MDGGPNFIARKFQQHQRENARILICPTCNDETGFPTVVKFEEHVQTIHTIEALRLKDEQKWEDFVSKAKALAQVS
jgi:hypothetical protein